jgi:hypothetical protein
MFRWDIIRSGTTVTPVQENEYAIEATTAHLGSNMNALLEHLVIPQVCILQTALLLVLLGFTAQ